jgi:hypothetical protein
MTDFILKNYPGSKLNLISAHEVPKTFVSTFRILYKPSIKDDLIKMFDGENPFKKSALEF